MNIVKLIAEKNLVEAEKLFNEQMNILARKKLLEVKKMIGARVTEMSDVFGQGYSGDSSILRNAMNRTYMNNNRSKIAAKPSRPTTASVKPTASRAPVRPSTAAVKPTPTAVKPGANDPGGSYSKPGTTNNGPFKLPQASPQPAPVTPAVDDNDPGGTYNAPTPQLTPQIGSMSSGSNIQNPTITRVPTPSPATPQPSVTEPKKPFPDTMSGF